VIVPLWFNPKGLAQVVKALVLRVGSLQGLRFNTSWVPTTPWGHWTGGSLRFNRGVLAGNSLPKAYALPGLVEAKL
jgi:hypothetical protein